MRRNLVENRRNHVFGAVLVTRNLFCVCRFFVIIYLFLCVKGPVNIANVRNTPKFVLLGAIDGLLIKLNRRILSGLPQPRRSYCRKGFFAVNLQVLF